MPRKKTRVQRKFWTNADIEIAGRYEGELLDLSTTILSDFARL